VLKGKPYHWEEIPGYLPEKPGVYAWYSVPDIPEYDIRVCISESTQLIEQGKPKEAAERVRKLISSSVLDKMAPPPYDVRVTGPLMPGYSGQIGFEDSMDLDVLLRLAQDPVRLHALGHALKQSVPYFTAPLYIGMSGNLRERLQGHKNLIEPSNQNSLSPYNEMIIEDQNFASEIKRRGIISSSLVVYVSEQVDNTQAARDIEYILNRSTFPVLGRR